MIYNNLDNIFLRHFSNESLLSFSNLNKNNINDLFGNEEDDRRYIIPNENISQDTNIKSIMHPNYNYENTTREKTDKRLKDLIENDNSNAPSSCSLNTISGILILNDNKSLVEKIIKDEKILESVQYNVQNMNSTKEKSKNNFKLQNDNIFRKENSIDLEYEEAKGKDNHLKKKRGRKTIKKVGKEHNRYHGDNIIKKIKAKLFDYCLNFINKMINKNNESSIKILKIDYKKYIDQLEKKKNLGLFEMTLKDLFSLDVSRKFSTKNKDYNKELINEILEQRVKVEDFDTIIFLFKMTFSDWIEIFTYKKPILSLINEYNASNVNYNKIQKNFIGVNHLLNKISGKYDCKYYILFLLYLFNFQRWFYIKRKRFLKKKGE